MAEGQIIQGLRWHWGWHRDRGRGAHQRPLPRKHSACGPDTSSSPRGRSSKPLSDQNEKIPLRELRTPLGLPIPKTKYWPVLARAHQPQMSDRTGLPRKHGSPPSPVSGGNRQGSPTQLLPHSTALRSNPSSCGLRGPWKPAFLGAGQREWFLPDPSV